MNSYINSVACRGVLFANKTPSASKWQPIYKPQGVQSFFKRKYVRDMVEQLFVSGATSTTEVQSQSCLLSPSSTLLMEVLPFMQKIAKFSRSRVSVTAGNNTTFLHLPFK